ncbi:GIY-YIG nuclease family protein [Phocaeicola faecalis]
MITIQELLYNRGLDRKAAIKLVRHKDRRIDLYNMYRTERNAFLEYQNTQSRDVFKGVDYIVSFIGEENTLARFIGVYKIDEKQALPDSYKYFMSEVSGYEDLKERVIIRWENAISWNQWIKNEMEVLEISPGLHYKRFTDYFDLILDFKELQEIVVENYKDWKIVLSAIKGIYLITDKNTGKLYVGSAYGEDGIWGRWKEYVATNGHGGNKSLKSLLDEDWEYACKYFQFSILMLLPKTVTADEAVRKEQLFKTKLGSNSFGLNNN